MSAIKFYPACIEANEHFLREGAGLPEYSLVAYQARLITEIHNWKFPVGSNTGTLFYQSPNIGGKRKQILTNNK